MKLLEVAEVSRERRLVGEAALAQQLWSPQDAEARYVMQRVFRVVLDGPEAAASEGDLHRLDRRMFVAREQRGRWSESDRVVLVTGQSIEPRGLAGEHRVHAAGGLESHAARDAELASAWMGGTSAATHGHGHVQSPATAEGRNAGFERGTRDLDVAADLGSRAVDGQVRSGPDDPVSTGEGWRRRVSVRSEGEDLDLGTGFEVPQEAAVQVAGEGAARAAKRISAGLVVGVEDQQAKHHRGRSPAMVTRSMRRCAGK